MGEGELQVSGWNLHETLGNGIVGSELTVVTASLATFPERLFPSPSEVQHGAYCPYDESLQHVMEEPDMDMRQDI